MVVYIFYGARNDTGCVSVVCKHVMIALLYRCYGTSIDIRGSLIVPMVVVVVDICYKLVCLA